jgi:hypothetical protein
MFSLFHKDGPTLAPQKADAQTKSTQENTEDASIAVASRLPELTKRTILMLKEQHPEWGCQRISDLLLRGPALPASASAVARVLHEAGYESSEEPSHRHVEPVRRFERAQPNQLWQTDLFTSREMFGFPDRTSLPLQR